MLSGACASPEAIGKVPGRGKAADPQVCGVGWYGFARRGDDLSFQEAFPMRDTWLLLNREKSRFYTKENSLNLSSRRIGLRGLGLRIW